MTVGLLGLAGPMNWWGNDGSAGAASGTPQLPHTLDLSSVTNGLGHNLATRAPWKVAGVDYFVGIPSNVTLQDPLPSGVLATALSALGGSYSSNTITFSGANASNATISGWDFSLHNGLGVVIQNCTNPTITSNKFGVGSNLNQPLLINTNVNGCTVEDNEFNGAGLENNNQVGYGLIESNGYGAILIQRNYFHDAFSEHMVLGNSSSGASNYQVQFNLFENAGLGQPTSHGDWVQIVSSSNYANVCSATFTFNTGIQNNTTTNIGSQGFSFNGNDHYYFGNCIMTFNTVLAGTPPTNGGVNTFFNADYGWLTGTGLVSNNYCDPTGLNDAISNWVQIVTGSGGTQPNTYTGSGNINMATGAAMPTEGNIS